jgi:hypothetical protein
MGMELAYLDFQIKLNLDLQTAVSGLLWHWTVLDSGLSDCAGSTSHVACHSLVHWNHLLWLGLLLLLHLLLHLTILLRLLLRDSLHCSLALLRCFYLLLLLWLLFLLRLVLVVSLHSVVVLLSGLEFSNQSIVIIQIRANLPVRHSQGFLITRCS